MASSIRTRRPERPPAPRRPSRRRAGATAPAPLRLRPARLADAAAIAGVMRAAVRALRRGPYSPRQLAAWSSLPALYHAWAMTSGGERYLVAEAGGRIVGYAAVRGRELTAVFVHPRAAGRGVGATLVARAEAAARRGGAARLVVRAAVSAVPFYAALGFRGGRRIAVPLPGGEALPSAWLSKPLDDGASTP